MDNLTHCFAGAVIAKTGLDRWSPLALPTAVIGANLPDIDSVALIWGRSTYLEHHRGLSHSMVGVLTLSLVLGALMRVVACLTPREERHGTRLPVQFSRLWAVSLISIASHPILDFTNSYGVRPFLPFKATWYYGDLVFIYDPFIWLILGGATFVLGARRVGHYLAWAVMALLATAFLAAPRFPLAAFQGLGSNRLALWWLAGIGLIVVLKLKGLSRMGPRLARIALGLLIAYWAALGVAHRAARDRIETVARDLSGGMAVSHVAALPTVADPLRWSALFETTDEIHYGVIPIGGTLPAPESFSHYAKGFDDPRVRAAAETTDGRTFLHFARYPFATVQGREDDWIVILRDARYERRARSGFAVMVIRVNARRPENKS